MNNEIVGGVVVANSETPTTYILIRNFNLRAYKDAEQIGDIDTCRSLTEPFDIGNVRSAEIIL